MPIRHFGQSKDKPRFWASLYKTAAQSSSHDTWLSLIFAGYFFNFGNLWNPTFPDRVYLPVLGLWRLSGAANFAFNATGRREIGISLNSSGEGDLAYASQPAVTSSSGSTQLNVGPITRVLGPLDYVHLNVRQDSSGSLNQTYGNFEVELIEPLAGQDLAAYIRSQVSARS